VIPNEAVEAAAKEIDAPSEPAAQEIARRALEAAAPHMLAAILEDCADTAETDELTTAAEVIYDLRRRAKDLRPKDLHKKAATHGND
jgi:hypothetical protein